MNARVFTGIVVFLAAALVGRADLVIVQKVEGGGQAGDQTIRIKGDKSRSDLAQPISVITDGATGGMTTLMHTTRTFMKVPAEQTKAMLEQIKKMRPTTDAPKLQPTGKKEKVGEYECEIFTTNLGTINITYWVAKDFPNYPAVLEQLDKFQSGAISAMGQGTMPALKDFPGMMIKTEIDLGGKKTTTTLVSAREENVDPAVFNVPASYKEVTSPALTFPPAK